MGLLEFLGLGPKVDYAALVKKDAVILDVRTKSEFQEGHIKGAINISVDQLSQQLHRLTDKNQAIITCCLSGARSGRAKSILQSSGYTQVYNGGSWYSLKNKI